MEYNERNFGGNVKHVSANGHIEIKIQNWREWYNWKPESTRISFLFGGL